jgi:hypothetical protein
MGIQLLFYVVTLTVIWGLMYLVGRSDRRPATA